MKKARPSGAGSVSPRDVFKRLQVNPSQARSVALCNTLQDFCIWAGLTASRRGSLRLRSCCCAASTAPTVRCLEAEKSQRQVQEKTDEATGVRLYRKRNTRELRILQQTLV